MTVILYLIVAIIYIWVLLTGSYHHFTHMLQLNSYFNSRYAKYLAKNTKELVDPKAVLSLAAYVLLIFGAFPVTSGYALLYLLFDMIKPKQAEKKPLVVTARVKRLFVTEGVLMALILVWGFFVSPAFIPALLFAAAFLAPELTALANAVNTPIEAAIKRHYYNMAKASLEAAKNLRVIGITGSYGKTSTKSYVAQLLSAKYKTLMTPGSYNTTMGVVRTINEMLLSTHEIFIVEMGARKKGDIKEICDLVKPESGILTAIGAQHLETFKSVDNIVSTKFELIDAVGDGFKFLNYDNEEIRIHASGQNIVTYGTTPDCDFYAKDIRPTVNGTEFTLVTESGECVIKTHLLGKHNVLNLTAAAAVASRYGMTLEEIAVAARRVKGVEHRLELKRAADCTIIDDAYNSNPAGAKSALETLSMFDGCRIVITPGMVELGEYEEWENEKLGALAVKSADYAIFVGKRQCPALVKGANGADGAKGKVIEAENIYDAFDKMRAIKAENKVVLLENDLPDNYL